MQKFLAYDLYKKLRGCFKVFWLRCSLAPTPYALGLYRQALEKLQLAVRTSGDRANLGRANHAIADVYVSLGQYEQAKDHYQQALTIR